jgi:hypothetical protein
MTLPDIEDNKMTMPKLKTLIADTVESIILDGEFVPFKTLKDEVHAELGNLVKKEDIKSFEAELEKLRNLPGPGGATKIDPADNALKGLDKTGGYDSFSAFAKDVYLADLQGAEPSPRFPKWLIDVRETNKVLKAAGTPSLEIGDPEQGGYLTPSEFANKTLERGFENSNFINRCTKVPMKINQIGIPFVKDFDHTTYVHGNMMAYWLDEKGLKEARKPKFGKVNLRLNKLAVMVFASDEILEDSVISSQKKPDRQQLLLFIKTFPRCLADFILSVLKKQSGWGILIFSHSLLQWGWQSGQAGQSLICQQTD